ncbi:MAG TPA: flagellar basal body-associated FliL family protein [Rhizomicrobium sp.]|nr:flagellar basal body-associated FliL family protein [Rhizomicrobium sp.]
MAKTPEPELDEENDDAEGEAGSKGRFSKKFLMIAGGGAAIVLLLLGAGVYFLFFAGSDDANKPKMVGNVVLPVVPPSVVFYDMPDLVVNIQSADSTPAYLKLSVALELAAPEEKPGIQALMPRIVDQFQSYLRELRIDDLHGSAGVLRVKEELLRRVNVAAAPYPVRDVLLKEMIVQ